MFRDGLLLLLVLTFGNKVVQSSVLSPDEDGILGDGHRQLGRIVAGGRGDSFGDSDSLHAGVADTGDIIGGGAAMMSSLEDTVAVVARLATSAPGFRRAGKATEQQHCQAQTYCELLHFSILLERTGETGD